MIRLNEASRYLCVFRMLSRRGAHSLSAPREGPPRRLQETPAATPRRAGEEELDCGRDGKERAILCRFKDAKALYGRG